MAYQKIRWKVRRRGNEWEGEVELPLSTMRAIPGLAPSGAPQLIPAGRPAHRVTVKAKGSTQKSALNRAAGIADQLLDNPLLQAALPPGSGAAIAAIKDIAKSGPAKGLAKYAGKGAKRIADAIKFW